MPVLTLDDLCTLFACNKSILSSKMYNCCWPNIHRFVLDGYELAEFKQRYPVYRGVRRLTVINQEGVDRLNFTGIPVNLNQLKHCEAVPTVAVPQLLPINITVNINGQADEQEILRIVSEYMESVLRQH